MRPAANRHITALLILLISSVGLMAGEKSGEQINWQVISSGGTDGASANYRMSGTVGQTAAGSGGSDNYGLDHGFWQDSWGGDCCNLGGDADNSESVNLLDATYLINYLYKGGQPPPCTAEGDPDESCTINLLDATHLINYLYKDGPAPVCGCVTS